jgi:xylulokinase
MPCYLGIDSSTQSCKGLVIDTDQGKVVLNLSIDYNTELPHYRSPEGFLLTRDPVVRHSDPLMWVEALDLLFERARSQGFDWSRVAGVSCSGQQHGSVYLNAGHVRASWDSSRPLAEQVRPLLSRPTAPIWMDSSTSRECAEIAQAAGGDAHVLAVTGSRATERFTGPQIRKFFKEDPDGYARTARVHLVSSFMAYLLTGESGTPIDRGDGAGMNLMDLASGDWNAALLEATAPGLREKLPAVTPSEHVVGPVADYFVKKYGLSPQARVVASSGDNPCSLVGMGATRPGTAVVSLGTSDTYFAAMSKVQTDPAGYGHVFGNPAGGFMSLICFKNGSLTRKKVAERFGLSWEDFSAAIRQTPPGNHGNLMLPYEEAEITPRILSPQMKLFGSPDFTAWKDRAAAVRAVVEAQALSMRLHSGWIAERPRELLVTGGASQNDDLLQVFADVFQARLRRLSVANSAGLGAALRAAAACGGLAWEELFARFAAPEPQVIEPNPAAAAGYDQALAAFDKALKDTFPR